MSDEFSVVEDLTPEADERVGVGRWRDIGIGVLLIAVVVGFVGWNWWRTEYQSGQYRAGQNALAAHDWEAAISYFRNATGYLDSDGLLDLAGKELAHTKEVYEKGVGFVSAHNWIAAMDTLGELKEENTSYKDALKLWGEAREQVYKDALQGAVAVRAHNDGSNLSVVPMGSKFGDFGGWYPLLNSDSYSQVLGVCTDGKILYDVPSTGWTPKQVYSSDPDGPPTEKKKLEGRLVVKGDLLTYTNADFLTLKIDPSLYNRFLCGRTGVWLYDYGPTGRPDYFGDLDNKPVRNAMAGYSLTYASFDGAISRTLRYGSAADTHEIPMAVDYNSDRMVVARWSGEDPKTGLITQETEVDLYLVTLDEGSEPQLIFRTKWNNVLSKSGGIQSVQISPDGRYVLVNEFVPLTVPGKHYETEVRFLIDTREVDREEPLQVAAADLDVYPANQIVSGFVKHGAYDGKMITSKFTGSQFEVDLVDPAAPDVPLATAKVDAFTTGMTLVSPINWTVAREDFDGVTLVGREEIRDGTVLVSWEIATIEISASGTVTTTPMFNANGWPRSFPLMVSEGRLIYTGDLDNQNLDWQVWSVPLDGKTTNEMNGVQVYGFKYGSEDMRQSWGRVAFGPKLLAYLDGESLHARSYDGKYDVVLEDGIKLLYGAWRFAEYANGLR